jgi:hypothetical protein
VLSEDAFSEEAFSDSPADVPPAALSEELELSSEPVPPDSPVEPEDSSLPVVVGVVEVVAVVDVEVVSVASFSADVSFGGVISGVLLGSASETVLPPHAVKPVPQRRIRALAPSAMTRLCFGPSLTRSKDPCAGRRWGSR